MDSDAEVARARLGRTVGGRWVLERVLGTGGMGAVYAARSPDGLVAAIKILHPEMGARSEVRERFLREGSAASKIGHAGVVQMLGQGDGEEAFLAMELLEGETLRDRVRRHGRLPLDEVLEFAAEVLDVLVAAHERGVVHRDLKPDNLFITLDNHVKVLDFGLARLLDGVTDGQHTRTGVALGTLAYMAPEQALGRRTEIDGRVDLFALGATMFRVLSGRRVHEAESEAELLMAMASRPAPPLRAVLPEVPENVAAIVDLALAFSRDARYPDARTMLSDLAAVRQGGAPPYATARLAARDERTRPEQPAASQRTQPLEVQPPVSQRTVPLAAYNEARSPYSAGPPAPNTPLVAPATRTEPLARVPAPAAPIVRTELLPAHVPNPAQASPTARGARKNVVLGVGALALAGIAVAGALLYYALARKPSGMNAVQAIPTSSALVVPASAMRASPAPVPAQAGAASAGASPPTSSAADPAAPRPRHRRHGRGPHG